MSREHFFRSEGFAAGLFSAAVYPLYALPMMHLSALVGKYPAAFSIGVVASLVMYSSLWHADKFAIYAKKFCSNSWRSCMVAVSITIALLLHGLIFYTSERLSGSGIGIAYSLGLFFFPILAAMLRGGLVAIAVTGVIVFLGSIPQM